MSGLDPNQTNYFSLAIKSGTIRGAAEVLGVEPSTVSRQIAALESRLGTTLIERGRKGIRLTEAGVLLEAFLRHQNAELESLQSELSALNRMQRGTISISVGEGFIGDFVSTVLASFSKNHPGITYTIHCGSTSQVMNEIKTDQAHLGLAYNAPPDRQIKSILQVRQPLMLLVSPDSAQATLSEPVSLKHLIEPPCAILDKGLGIGTLLSNVEGVHNIRFNTLVKTNSIALLKNFVREGMGISFLPEFVAAREISDQQIIAKKTALAELNAGKAHLVMRQGRTLPAAATKIATHLQQYMNSYRK